jgi:hypothetical protein
VTFQAWVEQLIAQRFGTATALARQLGMQLSPFTRGVAAGTLNLVNLLKLAQVAEEHPSAVLRLAKKADVAELLEQLYGNGREALTPSQRAVIEDLAQIPDDVREHFVVLIRHARNVAVHGAAAANHARTGAHPEPRARRRRANRRPIAARSE